jgi:hypothetical protein
MLPDEIIKQIPTEPKARADWWRKNFKRIGVSPKLAVSGVVKNQILRRFVDLPKLFDLLNNKRLVLPRLKQLIKGDPFECFCQKNYDHLDRPELEKLAKQLEIYAPSEAKGTIYPPEITNVWMKIGLEGKPLFDHQIQKMPLQDLKRAVWYLERERLKNELVCCCWYKGASESDAMWKIYASQLGVFISSSAARMESAMKLMMPKIYASQTQLKLAAVHYDNTDTCKNQEPWLIKRKAFVYEKEVRLFCDVPFIFGEQFEIGVDVQKFIKEIVITPFAAPWQVSGIKGAIETLLKNAGASKIPVRQSSHMNPPEINWPLERKTPDGSLVEALRPLIGSLK